MSEHPRMLLNDQFSNPIRLSLMAALMRVDEIDFQTLRDALEISDSAMSKQIGLLETCRYIHVRKGFVGKRPRTWLSSTPAGRKAFTAHVAALQRVIGANDPG